jgi:hypothetical protein
MFWPVLRRCHILGWDWSVLPLGASFHFPFWELWCILVSVCFHNLVTYAHRLQDLCSACLMFWMRTHTEPRFIVSSEGRESHQPQVIFGRLIQTRKSLSLTGREPRTSRIGVGRANHCATGSLSTWIVLMCWFSFTDVPEAQYFFLIFYSIFCPSSER